MIELKTNDIYDWVSRFRHDCSVGEQQYLNGRLLAEYFAAVYQRVIESVTLPILNKAQEAEAEAKEFTRRNTEQGFQRRELELRKLELECKQIEANIACTQRLGHGHPFYNSGIVQSSAIGTNGFPVEERQ